MKSIQFKEEQFHNLNEIGKELFCDKQDPRSTAYIRKLKRPAINWFKICLCMFLPIILIVALIVFLNYIGFSMMSCIITAVALLLLYITLTLKKSAICIIKVYQRYAPESLRNKCRFEPSCSEYMVLSIEMYGLFKGLKKGICRLKRCNINGGGFDFP
ncbi:MAG: membrane protein insertion efficiency factor YidD [Lachnospiraceae bacterium]|nr:membrane protein insertion efficiency factor YidD [Lachnospiraceae bacterium]